MTLNEAYREYLENTYSRAETLNILKVSITRLGQIVQEGRIKALRGKKKEARRYDKSDVDSYPSRKGAGFITKDVAVRFSEKPLLERKIILCAIKGLTEEEIAGALKVSLKVVKIALVNDDFDIEEYKLEKDAIPQLFQRAVSKLLIEFIAKISACTPKEMIDGIAQFQKILHMWDDNSTKAIDLLDLIHEQAKKKPLTQEDIDNALVVQATILKEDESDK